MADDKLILVVDDEARMVRFVRMNLELEGYQVSDAGSGMEALEKVRDELPDLVVLDVMMPQMDGFETLEHIREISNVPVIMLTVKGDEEDRIRGLELGPTITSPPFSPRELVSRIRAVLRRAEMPTPAAPRCASTTGWRSTRTRRSSPTASVSLRLTEYLYCTTW